MDRKTVGLVSLWDCVAFDEVAGINFKDKDSIQIMKDYMASGSFASGKAATNTAFNFLNANSNRISGSISTTSKDYIVNYQDLHEIGMTEKLALPTAYCTVVCDHRKTYYKQSCSN